MFCIDVQNEIPVSYCECCHGEIYSGDVVYDLAQIYMGGRHIVHEDCIIDSLEDNKELVTQFLFSDLCLLTDIFDSVLTKIYAHDIFDDWREDDDGEWK